MSDVNSLIVLFAEAEPAADPGGGPSAILAFLPWILIGVLFYVMIIRPQNRKQAELSSMLKTLKKNDRVLTVGGIYGTVVNAPQDSDDVTLKVDESNNTRLRVQRTSIKQVITAEVSESKDN